MYANEHFYLAAAAVAVRRNGEGEKGRNGEGEKRRRGETGKEIKVKVLVVAKVAATFGVRIEAR
jgi:hypothetical protein